MSHLPEPFHSVTPLLDPTRELTPPARLRATVLAALDDIPDAGQHAAHRPSRRRPVLALVAACLVMLAAAGLVARARSAPVTPGVAVVRYPGIEDRTPSPGAAVPSLTSCPAGHRLAPASIYPTYDVDGTPTPQEALLRYESQWSALLQARGVVAKWVQDRGATVRALYLDSRGEPLTEVVVGHVENGSWSAVRARDCIRVEPAG